MNLNVLVSSAKNKCALLFWLQKNRFGCRSVAELMLSGSHNVVSIFSYCLIPFVLKVDPWRNLEVGLAAWICTFAPLHSNSKWRKNNSFFEFSDSGASALEKTCDVTCSVGFTEDCGKLTNRTHTHTKKFAAKWFNQKRFLGEATSGKTFRTGLLGHRFLDGP